MNKERLARKVLKQFELSKTDKFELVYSLLSELSDECSNDMVLEDLLSQLNEYSKKVK